MVDELGGKRPEAVAIGAPATDARRRLAARHLLIGGGLALTSGLCFSSGGFFVRSVSVDAWEIIFVRCLFAALTIGILIVLRERGGTWAAFRRAGWPAVFVGVTTGWAIIAYVLAMQHTLVANVIAIMTTSTVIVALLARPILGEPVSLRTWLAMGGSLCGIGIMFGGDTGAGGIIGNLLAFSIALAIGAQTLIARRYRTVAMEPAVFLAACFAGIIALPIGLPLEASAREFGLMAAFGIVQLAIALTAFFYAARYLPAPILIFVVLIDAVLAPIWVWLGFGEIPTTLGFVGAGVILGSVALNALAGLRTLPLARRAG